MQFFHKKCVENLVNSKKSSTFALGFDSEPNLLLNLRRINIRLSKVFFPALRSGRSAPLETVALAFEKGTFLQSESATFWVAYMVAVAQLVRASDCGSEGCGIVPHLPPR